VALSQLDLCLPEKADDLLGAESLLGQAQTPRNDPKF